ncbi:MAG TPA: hypothetical protein VL172_20295 [Kofleriaceae bacterium]|nr:hypothetical protein [Kofleriaceae bacterium]
MSYYLRYFVDDDRPFRLADMRGALQSAAPALQLSVEGELSTGEELLAQVEVNAQGTDLFQDEVGGFLGAVQHSAEPGRGRVEPRLRAARAVVAVQVLAQAHAGTPAADSLTAFYAWLQSFRRGLFQADGQGFYDNGELILQLG